MMGAEETKTILDCLYTSIASLAENVQNEAENNSSTKYTDVLFFVDELNKRVEALQSFVLNVTESAIKEDA